MTIGVDLLNSNLEDLFGSKSPAQIQDDDYDLTKYDYKASAVPGTVYGLLEVMKDLETCLLKSFTAGYRSSKKWNYCFL